MLREGAEFKDLPLAADLSLTALSEFGAIMLQGGIIFSGARHLTPAPSTFLAVHLLSMCTCMQVLYCPMGHTAKHDFTSL